MNKEKLEQEHAQLKDRLAELVDFINSEEFFRQNDVDKQLIATQRSGMEMYLNALSLRLWGNNTCNPSMSSMLPLMLSSIMLPSFSSPSPSVAYLKDQFDKKDDDKGGSN